MGTREGGAADADAGAVDAVVVGAGPCGLAAAISLERAGFTRIFNVRHGFEGEMNEKHQRNSLAGWRFAGLPWEQC